MRKYIFPLFLAPLMLLVPTAYSQTIVDNTYINTRFHYTFILPEGFGKPFEADNGDGIILKAKNGKAELRVSAGYIVLTGSFLSEIQQYFDWVKESDWHIDTSDLNDKYAIWRATKGNQKVYNFTIPYCDSTMANIELRYNVEEKNLYNSLIPTLIKSLKVLPNACQ